MKAAASSKPAVQKLRNQNDMIKRQMHNLDVKFNLAKLNKLHLN